MQKYLRILSVILCILLGGCGTVDETAGIEFYTLDDDAWVTVSTSSETTAAPKTSAAAESTEPTETEPLPADTDACTYILNTGTKKFHDPSCKSASRIKESNRDEFTGNRSDLLARGYEPCKVCDP